ncbi:hypothetical protein ACFYTQ_18530 [Nocardia sp. NPDC004068]|uniref:hypothetical protein n=1 Tax=Nocardia sp. NPDC004068 TaxID=3364303 RepID=UPI003673CEA0
MLLYETMGHATHRTDLGDKIAVWEVDGSGVPRILFLHDHTTGRPAYRWPGTPLRGYPSGHISFGPDTYPTLATAIALLPEYEATLWEAVRAEHRATDTSRDERTS